MTVSLLAATAVGLVSLAFFDRRTLSKPGMLFIHLVKGLFSPFFIGLILCVIFAASININIMCSQILVLCSSFTEDSYKRIFRKTTSSDELLLVSRAGVICVSLVSYMIAYYKASSIYAHFDHLHDLNNLILKYYNSVNHEYGVYICLL